MKIDYMNELNEPNYRQLLIRHYTLHDMSIFKVCCGRVFSCFPVVTSVCCSPFKVRLLTCDNINGGCEIVSMLSSSAGDGFKPRRVKPNAI